MLLSRQALVCSSFSFGLVFSLFCMTSAAQETVAQVQRYGYTRNSSDGQPVRFEPFCEEEPDLVPKRICMPRRYGRGYYKPVAPKREWHHGLNNEEVRAKTIWSGADSNDRKIQADILEKQLRDSPEAPETIRAVWSGAQYFLACQKPALAEPLLKELVATIASHKMTNENRSILAQARAKLTRLEQIREKVKDKGDSRTDIAVRFRNPVGIGLRQY